MANRSGARAQALAQEIGGTQVALELLPLFLERADAVICATGAEQHVVTHAQVESALRARRCRPLFLVDLALPRNVEPRTNGLPDVYVYDLDDLERLAAQNRGQREAEAASAAQIVEEELAAHFAQERERSSVPAGGPAERPSPAPSWRRRWARCSWTSARPRGCAPWPWPSSGSFRPAPRPCSGSGSDPAC